MKDKGVVKKLEQELQGLVEGLASALAKALVGAEVGELLRLGGAEGGERRRGPGRPRKAEGVEKKVGRPKGSKGPKGPKQEERPKKELGLNREGKPKRWDRRRVGEVNELVEEVVVWVKENGKKEGVAAAEIASGVGRDVTELVRPVQKAVEEGEAKEEGGEASDALLCEVRGEILFVLEEWGRKALNKGPRGGGGVFHPQGY